MKSAVLMLAAFIVCCAGTAGAQCCYNEMDLSGVWKSGRAEHLGNGTYELREYRFTPKTFARTFTRFSDSGGKGPQFLVTAEGTYTVNEASQRVPGAYLAAFRFTKKSITLLTTDKRTVERLGLGACGLEPGVPRDITRTGCARFASVDDEPVEYDIVRRDKSTLMFGKRPADGNMGSDDHRPAGLGSALTRTDSGK